MKKKRFFDALEVNDNAVKVLGDHIALHSGLVPKAKDSGHVKKPK